MGKKQLHQNEEENDQFKSQNSECSQGDVSNDHNESQHNEEIADNMEIPFEEYRKSFSMFNNRNKPQSLKSFVKIKSQMELDSFNYVISSLQSCSQQQTHGQQKMKNLNNQIKNPQEFFSQCKVPPNTTIFIHIFSVNNKRCNIKITNASGYIFAYLTDIMPSRKFYKVYKLLTKIGNKSLFIIFDEYDSISKDSSFVKKISDYAKNFCYYSLVWDGTIPQKFTNINLYEQRLIQLQGTKKQKPTFVWIQNHTFWYFSEIFTKQQQEFQSILKSMKSIQQKIQNSIEINQLNKITDSSIDFIIRIILNNLSKFKKKQTFLELLQSFKSMVKDHNDLAKQKVEEKFGNPLYHYPELLKASKQCIHCHNNKDKIFYTKVKQNQISIKKDKKDFSDLQASRRNKTKQSSKIINIDLDNSEQMFSNKKSKTKYRCEGCSAEAKKDIALCLDCFEGYHKKKQQLKRKSIKKAEYLSELKKQRKKIKMESKNGKNNSLSKENVEYQDVRDRMYEQTNQAKNQGNDQNEEKQMSSQEVSISKMNLNIDVGSIIGQKFQGQPVQQNILMNVCFDEEDSEHSIDTRNKLQQLQQNEQYNKVIQKLDEQKKTFFQIFQKLIKNKKTRKIAKITMQHLKYKSMSLFDQQQK